MSRVFRLLISSLLVASFLLPLAPPQQAHAEDIRAEIGAVRSAGEFHYFKETGHGVSGDFYHFFNRWGGIDVFGYPITEPFVEDGRTVQYFQRHRMEAWPEHPEPWRVQLTLLGDALFGPFEQAVPPPFDTSLTYYKETGHTVGKMFESFFFDKGDIVLYGYPTGEPYLEGGHWMQRFQRGRLEYRPENPPAYQVEPGLLGVVYLERLGAERAKELMKPVDPSTVAGEWFTWGAWTDYTWHYLPSKLKNNAVAVAAIDGTVLVPGQSWNFIPVLQVPGYVPGLGYGPGNSFIWMGGGGVCASATAMYRAAYNAGLDIPVAEPHSLASYPPWGWDATVEEGGLDLRITNNTDTEIRFRANIDYENGTMTYWVEGRTPPDRTVVRRGPYEIGYLSYVVYRDITYTKHPPKTETRYVSYYGIPGAVPQWVMDSQAEW